MPAHISTEHCRNKVCEGSLSITMTKVLGILGAGKVGTAIGQLALKADWQVLYYDIAPAEQTIKHIALACKKAQLVSLPELIRASDVVLIAIPIGFALTMDLSPLSGKIVIDPTNYWPTSDGSIPMLADLKESTSSVLLEHNPEMRLVKTLNHISYHDLSSDSRSAGITPRRALAVSSDDIQARRTVAGLLDDLGFDPVEVSFDKAKLLESSGPLFGQWLDQTGVREALGQHDDISD